MTFKFLGEGLEPPQPANQAGSLPLTYPRWRGDYLVFSPHFNDG